ncbi:MAG: SLC13 family permease [Desulfurococcus sp.]|nr:SLC13 family permease [Desulfurococcus sp.]
MSIGRLIAIMSVIFIISYLLMSFIHLSGPMGEQIIEIMRREYGSTIDPNSSYAVFVEALTMTIFFTVIALTVIKMEWRVAAAAAGIGILALTGIVPPQNFVNYAVDWNLILFLIGSMTLAGILKEAGVFKKLAVNLMERSESASILLTLLGLFSAFSSIILGEVTSIIYAMMIVLELSRILKVSVKPLIVFTVLATNTGSLALPIGNPIGLYIAFQADIPVVEFVVRSFTLSLLELAILILLFKLIQRSYVSRLDSELKASREQILKLATSRTLEVNHEAERRFRMGVLVLFVFITLVVSSEYIAKLLSDLSHVSVSSSSLLAFTPYFSIVLALILIDPARMNELVSSAVEWPSVVFFISLFILAYSLSYTGAIAKIAYMIASVAEPGTSWGNIAVTSVLLTGSAALSSVLDNLSVVVTLMQPTILLVKLGLTSMTYFALLYGGVLGGNYTPIGSTANIIAVSMAERSKMSVSWGEWLKIAFVTTTSQIIMALAWSYMWIMTGG